MAKNSLPPGFRFHPTDVELSLYYLKRKIMGKPFRFEAISEIELYKFTPWDLPDKSCLQTKDLEWYFFCHGDKKYSNSLRNNRSTDTGYWKTTGKDRSITYNSRIVARKKTLIFHLGRVPRGVRTNWVMHEYRMEDKELADAGFLQDAYVLCRIFKKSGPGPKIGEQYGAPFREEDWEDEVNESSVLVPPICDGSMNVLHQFSDSLLESDSFLVDSMLPSSQEYVNVDGLLQLLSESNSNEIFAVQDGEMPDPLILSGSFADRSTVSDGNEILDGLEDLFSNAVLKSADGTYFPNDIGLTLEHDLLDLSIRAEPGLSNDVHYLTNNGIENALHGTQWGIGGGSYMETNNFQLPAEGPYSQLAASDHLFGYNSYFQNSNSSSVPPHINDTHMIPPQG